MYSLGHMDMNNLQLISIKQRVVADGTFMKAFIGRIVVGVKNWKTYYDHFLNQPASGFMTTGAVSDPSVASIKSKKI